jgi:bifunctional UDP-N-acetylglucosamine pyrophosphorylase / glucosamine-1-phosphate N-acetyltransferase
MATIAVVLAAGLGTRMKSKLPKVLHPILGDPSLLWVLRTLPRSIKTAVVVVHHGKEKVQAALEKWTQEDLLPCAVIAVDQGEPLGTGHAIKMCAKELDRLGASRVVILSGDVPLIARGSVASLCESEAALLAMELDDPASYGRVLQKPDGTLAGLVEFKDANESQRKIRLVNGGAYALPWAPLKAALGTLKNHNAQKEYYLTDAVVQVAQGLPVRVDRVAEEELLGMNSRLDQSALQSIAQRRINEHWMKEGVSFLHAQSSLVGPRVELSPDALIEPGVRLEGWVRIGENVRIGQGSILVDCQIDSDAEIRPYCAIEKARVGLGARVGPFARIREGTELGEGVHIGNFVETKKASFRKNAKANHLAYVGDAEVGEDSNIGAGVITCNYDGVRKHRTVIGKNVFVGSDSQLVAPVQIEDGAMIAAGTTVTQNVPKDALALSRTPQVIKENGAKRLRERQKGEAG